MTLLRIIEAFFHGGIEELDEVDALHLLDLGESIVSAVAISLTSLTYLMNFMILDEVMYPSPFLSMR